MKAQTTTYLVEGMTCEHCAAAVREEVAGVDGVREVAVELASGRLMLGGEGFSEARVADAVAEAGYRLAGRG